MADTETTASGDLGPSTLSRVVAWLAGTGSTGCLVVEHDQLSSRVFFRAGRPCGAVVMIGFKPLGLLLMEHGVIDIDALESSLNEVASSGRSQGSILVEQGHLSPEALAYWLWAQQCDRLHRVLALTEGSFRFDPSADLPPWTEDLDLSPHLEVLRFLRSEAGTPHVDRLLFEFGDAPAILSHFDPASVFKLDEEEQGLVGCLAHAQTLEEAARKSVLPQAKAKSLLAALYCFHYVTPFEESRSPLADAPMDMVTEVLDGLGEAYDRGEQEPSSLEPPPEVASWRAPSLGVDRQVRYQSDADLLASIDIFIKQGALLVATEETLRAGEPFELKLIFPRSSRWVALTCALSAVPEPGLSLLRIITDAPIGEVVSWIVSAAADQPSQPAPPQEIEAPRRLEEERELSTVACSVGIPATAALCQPKHPADLLLGPVTAKSSSHPEGGISPMHLLAWLRSGRDDFTVEISAPPKLQQTFEVLGGYEIAAPIEASLLARPLTTKGARYQVLPLAKPSSWRQRSSLQKLVVATTKAILRNFEEPELEEGLGSRLALCPRLSHAGRRSARRLSFSPAQERVVLHALDGTRQVDAILSAGIGRRAAWEILYLIEMRGGFEWIPPPEREIEDPVATRWQAVQNKDHFGVLGLHWSSHPDLVSKEYGKLKKLYGPSGRLRDSSPELALQLWERIETAKIALESKAGRAAHRKERYPGMSFSYQAELLVGQAKLSLVRGEIEQTRILLESALDVAPISSAGEMLRSLGSP